MRNPAPVFLLGHLAALSLVAAPAAPAPAEAEPAPARGVQGTATERGRTSLIHLRSGKILRAPARETSDGSWEIRHGTRWVSLPRESVERVALEKEVLRRARELERELGREPEPEREVAYCDWLIRAGLYKEALQAIDRVLRRSPDLVAAQELLRRSSLPVVLPSIDAAGDAETVAASLAHFFARIPSGSPTARELAAQRLAETPEIPGLIEALRSELVHPSARHRTFAAFLLRRVIPGHEVRPLLHRAILDSSAAVRAEASLALRDVANPAVIVPVVRALGSARSAVRSNAIAALGTMGYAAAVEPLVAHLLASGSSRVPHANVFIGGQIAYVADYDVEVAQGASIADPKISVLGHGATLDAAVLGVSSVAVRAERAAAMRALESLTGATPGRTAKAWQGWWETHGDAWSSANPPIERPTSPYSPESRETSRSG